MRIVFATLFKEGYGGGEGRVAHEMAHQLAQEHRVALICPDDRTRLFRHNSGVLVLGIKSAGEGNVCLPVLGSKQVKAIFEFLDDLGPDVVHAHEPASLGLIVQIWAKMHRVPVVHTAHVLPSRALGFGAADAIKAFKGPLTSSVARTGMEDFYRNCDGVIALNRFAAEDIRRFGYEGQLFVVPNGRNLAAYSGCAPADRDAPIKTLCFTGFINRRKNQLYLIQMLSHLSDEYRLLLVGEAIDREYEQLLHRTCDELGLEERVEFAGQVAHDDIPGILAGAHIFVSASKMEVQSLSIIEALASGTPVVGLANETIEELVNEQVGGCLAPDTAPASFALHVERVCSVTAPEYARLCAAARERVVDLDWSRVMGLMTDVYQLLIDRQPSADSGAEISDIIAWVPSEEVRQFLLDRTELASLRLSQVTARRHNWRALHRVSGRTWAVVGLTVAASVVGGALLGPALSSRIKRLKSELWSWGQDLLSLANERSR